MARVSKVSYIPQRRDGLRSWLVYLLDNLSSYVFSFSCSITHDQRPLPPPVVIQKEDDELFAEDPWVMAPIRADYGTNIRLGPKAFLNFNSVFVDTCPVNIGARCLIGPNCCFYSGTHPLDPAVRNGTEGPEMGKEIHIGDDCWLGGNVIVLPGITIGQGSTIGAGSVVTKVFPGNLLPVGLRMMTDKRL